jgi:hypothetical protein
LAQQNAAFDKNFNFTLTGITDDANKEIRRLLVDPTTGRLKVTGTVTMAYPSAGIANSTGAGWGTSFSTTGSGSVVALATSPVFTTPSLGAASAASIVTSGKETYNEAFWSGGHVTYVPLTGDIQTYINNATAGDTLILASGSYTITSSITINKQLNIMGQGNAGFVTAPITASHGTLITSSTASVLAFSVTNSNVRVAHLSINLTGDTSAGIVSANNLTGLVFTNIDVILNCTGSAQGFVIKGSNAVLRNLTYYVASTNSSAVGLYVWNDNSTTQDAVVDCYSVTGTAVGAATAAYGVYCYNNNVDKGLTVNLTSSSATALSGTPLDIGVVSTSTTTNRSIVNSYLSTINGADYDAYQSGSNQLNLGGSVIFNGTFSGTVTTRTTMAATNGIFGGLITSSGKTGIGYATGAGSTVSQTVSKSTGVTINAACGTITMNNASLAADTSVSFTVTDSTVAATDCVFAQHDSGGTLGAYVITANTMGAGSFNITVHNTTPGALAEAIVIRFAVIKAVIS